MDTTLTPQEISDMVKSLIMRINYIQTGNVLLSAEDAQNAGKTHLVKPLTEEQMRAILRMKDTLRALEKLGTIGNVRLLTV